ncbi:unnamed protein product [Darwinula stevensoni]|uniref:ZP domain-containing protein n=1 Tax=Darwinula stevensoni TaxID=69355 RepID=A0A7R9A4I0_9CRUS|nr:unnamed protein product [Darwinula stevensoni]CAG0893633.1 unnamed protein product [Darwinula stevensoni]
MLSSPSRRPATSPGRYVLGGESRDRYSFSISVDDCGTAIEGAGDNKVIANTIVLQMDPLVQEAWDAARKVSCVWSGQQEKTVKFDPFQVGMLEVISQQFSGDMVDCWMAIQRGEYPEVSPITGIVEIGEPLTLLIYLREESGSFDIHVKDCYAYDSMEYDSPETIKVQLTDENGCPRKTKLIGFWETTTDTRDSGATLIAYNRVSAFKFPDKAQIFVTCNVEVRPERLPRSPMPAMCLTHPLLYPQLCKGPCDNPCRGTGQVVTTRRPFVCTPGSTDPRCPRPTTTDRYDAYSRIYGFKIEAGLCIKGAGILSSIYSFV